MGKFIDSLTDQATGGIGSAVGGAMGIALGAINDKRQLKQQKKLSEQQLGIDKQMTDYSYQKQLEMWKNTNYEAQKEQMQQAGLNPGLLYGMSGGGGVTTGSGAASSKGTQAPSGGGEALGIMQMKLQTELLQAQKDNIESQTNKNNVEAAKTAGVDTEEAKTRITTGLQNIEESKTKQSVQRLDALLKETELAYQKETLDDRIEYLGYTIKKAFAETEIIQNQAFVSRNTMNEQVKLIQNQVIQSLADIFNTKADTQNKYAQNQNIKADTKLKGTQNLATDAVFKKTIQDTMIGWDKLSNEDKMIRLDEMTKHFNQDLTRAAKQDLLNLLNIIAKPGTTVNNTYNVTD